MRVVMCMAGGLAVVDGGAEAIRTTIKMKHGKSSVGMANALGCIPPSDSIRSNGLIYQIQLTQMRKEHKNKRRRANKSVSQGQDHGRSNQSSYEGSSRQLQQLYSSPNPVPDMIYPTASSKSTHPTTHHYHHYPQLIAYLNCAITYVMTPVQELIQR